MPLTFIKYIDLPKHKNPGGGFDHGDVDNASGRLFVAHTANNSIEVVDGEKLVHTASISGCQEASGVLCAQQDGLIFAAARGKGKLLVIDSKSYTVLGEVMVGPKPNGLAWDPSRRQLLVADVQDYSARLLRPQTGSTPVSKTRLAGRPRWCVYDIKRDRYLVNIKDPAGVAILSAESLRQDGFIPVSVPGPHGLDIDYRTDRAFVACDGRAVVSVDLKTKKEAQKVTIAGEPDVVWYNAKSNLLYCAIGNPGVIEVIDTMNMSIVNKVPTEQGAHTLTFDSERRQLYVFMPKTCQVAVYREEKSG
jgi:DNA-binding beta-propeller fold protein YncE